MADAYLYDLLNIDKNKKITHIKNLIIENNNKNFKIFWNKDGYIKNRWTMKINKSSLEVVLNSDPTGYVSSALNILHEWSDSQNIERLYYGI